MDTLCTRTFSLGFFSSGSVYRDLVHTGLTVSRPTAESKRLEDRTHGTGCDKLSSAPLSRPLKAGGDGQVPQGA
jgi:hypothetical protein